MSAVRFIDVEDNGGKAVVNRENLQKIDKFIADPLSRCLPSDSRSMYVVPWHTGGITTDVSQQTQVRLSVYVEMKEFLRKCIEFY